MKIVRVSLRDQTLRVKLEILFEPTMSRELEKFELLDLNDSVLNLVDKELSYQRKKEELTKSQKFSSRKEAKDFVKNIEVIEDVSWKRIHEAFKMLTGLSPSRGFGKVSLYLACKGKIAAEEERRKDETK